MTFPSQITSTALYQVLRRDPELEHALSGLRKMADSLAQQISRTVPNFTDHTIRHFDALWGVVDKVLTPPEFENLQPAEAFLLAAGFYLHDIGMAYATTGAGLDAIRASAKFQETVSRLTAAGMGENEVNANAIADAVRTKHAAAAMELAVGPIPGTDWHLIEARSFRDAWGQTCGRIAESHHWSIEKVDEALGMRDAKAPLPGGRSADLAYVACLLRVVDFAHINRERALDLDRSLRPALPPESAVHWDAQRDIDGPDRDGGDLVYRSARDIASVDAWWLYFSMLRGLDEEIRAVGRYLHRRSTSRGRLSLQGVRGAASPEEAAVFVRPSGFLPIEVNIRAGSIEKLVQLLAGESLYGPDPMAAVRELVQNAADAVGLKSIVAQDAAAEAAAKLPISIRVTSTGDEPTLAVTDHGVGMSDKIMTNYLVSIASDYWQSQYFSDYPTAVSRGFKPAGKFGIGFLSVFMLGETVTVESNRRGEARYRMTLRGVGRRGEIFQIPALDGSGTTVKILLKKSVLDDLKKTPALVKAYAPMLRQTLAVEVDGASSSIEPDWFRKLDAKSFVEWVEEAMPQLSGYERHEPEMLRLMAFGRLHTRGGMPRERTKTWPKKWPEFSNANTRLVADFMGRSLLCLRGLTIQSISTPGFVGVIQVDSVVTDTSRSRAISGDTSAVLEEAVEKCRPQIVMNLDAMAEHGLVVDWHDYISRCVKLYGTEVLRDSTVPWISLLELPGNVKQIGCGQLVTALQSASSLFLGFGTGPWSAMRKWVPNRGDKATADLAIVLEGRQDHVPYTKSFGESETGSLEELWPEWQQSTLLSMLLSLIAEAWGTTAEKLVAQPHGEHARDELFLVLSKT